MKTFTIKRNKWCRGGKGGPSALLNSEGNMCCLGFFALALGAERAALKGIEAPHCLVRDNHDTAEARKFQKLFRGLVRRDKEASRLAANMMAKNDTEAIEESERETSLTRMFGKLGWKPMFE